MRVLAIDTATEISAVALVDGGCVVVEDDTPSVERHGAVLAPRVQALMARARWRFDELGLLAIGLGPGSFTGLRVGLALVKGIALATGVPVRGVCSLAASESDATRARFVAEEARIAFEREGASDLATLEPIYGRPADVTEPRPK